MIAFVRMVEERDPPRPALKEFVMRYTPAALALALAVAVTSSVGYGADRQADPRAAALISEGRSELASGQVQAAIDSFEAALAVDPAHTPIYLDLAEAARQSGLQGKAIRYYREALERDPNNLAAISGEGMRAARLCVPGSLAPTFATMSGEGIREARLGGVLLLPTLAKLCACCSEP